MRKLLLVMFGLTLAAQADAQCNAAGSVSVAPLKATVTNTSTPTATTGISTYYTFLWGDGTFTPTTTNAAQMHVYAAAGTYTITLRQTVIDSTVNPPKTCIDSVQFSGTQIPPLPHISGDIGVDSTGTIDSYMVWLIKFDAGTNILSAVDSLVTVTGTGSKNRYAPYVFSNVPNGSYRVKAARHNGPTTGTGHVPTYHFNSLMWNTATVINHTGGLSSGNNILMQKGTLTSGPGFVGGNVTMGANKGTGAGIPDLTVFLVDGSGKVIAFATTDANGAYSFSNIPVGSYSVAPENLNYVTTAATLNVTAGSTNVTGVNFERSNKNKTIIPVTSGITNVQKTLTFTVFPNPATDVVTINWNTLSGIEANITITDVSGKTVYSNTSYMNANATIDVSSLQAGFYFLNVNSERGGNTQKLVIQ